MSPENKNVCEECGSEGAWHRTAHNAMLCRSCHMLRWSNVYEKND